MAEDRKFTTSLPFALQGTWRPDQRARPTGRILAARHFPAPDSSPRKERAAGLSSRRLLALMLRNDQLIVSDVVGFFGVDCLPSSLALSPGQAQAEALARENTTANRAAMCFMCDLRGVAGERSIYPCGWNISSGNCLRKTPDLVVALAGPQPVILRFTARVTMRRRWASGRRLKLVFTAPWVKAVRFE